MLAIIDVLTKFAINSLRRAPTAVFKDKTQTSTIFLKINVKRIQVKNLTQVIFISHTYLLFHIHIFTILIFIYLQCSLTIHVHKHEKNDFIFK